MYNIRKIEVVNYGQDNCQYWPGCTAMWPIGGVQYDEVYVGTGDNSKEAYEDAVSIIEGSDLYHPYPFPKNPAGVSKRDKVPAKLLSESDGEFQCYVAIYFQHSEHHEPEPSKIGDSRQARFLGGSDETAELADLYQLDTNSESIGCTLAHVAATHTRRFKRLLKETTGIISWHHEGEYVEIWATTDSANFLKSTTYYRIK